MLDVEFLLQPCSVERTMVYRYRSGALLPRMRKALQRLAESRGLKLDDCGPRHEKRFGSIGLFRNLTLTLCDWSLALPGLDGPEVEELLSVLAQGKGGHSIHLVEFNRRTRKHKQWGAVEKACFVVDEPAVTADALSPILRYLDATTTLLDRPNLADQPGFVESFSDLIDRSSSDLTVVQHLYTERVLTCVDMQTQRFDPQRHQTLEAVAAGARSPYGCLRTMIQHGGESGIIDFVAALRSHALERGWSSEKVNLELFAISRLLIGNAMRAEARAAQMYRLPTFGIEPIAFSVLVLWAATLLGWEDRLARACQMRSDGFSRGADVVFYTIDQMCREFREGAALIEADADPLEPRWGVVRRGMIGIEFDAARRRALARAELMEAVADDHVATTAAAHAPWVGLFLGRARAGVERAQLRRDWRRKVAKASSNDEELALSSVPSRTHGGNPPPLFRRPEGLDDVLGRSFAVETIKRFVRHNGEAGHLILHGPYGVGKRMLAHLCTKALLCAHSRVTGLSCNLCSSCRSFGTGGSLGFARFNAAERAAKRNANLASIVKLANSASLADRRVVMIENSALLAANEFDQLLKTLEERDATFVFTTQDLGRIRPAIRSRSVACAVGRLTRDEAREQLALLLTSRDVDITQDAVSVLVELSQGVPSRIIGLAQRFAGPQVVSSAKVWNLLREGSPDGLDRGRLERREV